MHCVDTMRWLWKLNTFLACQNFKHILYIMSCKVTHCSEKVCLIM